MCQHYYQQFYTNKPGDLEEIDKFLATHNLRRLNHKEIENWINSITSEVIESVIKKLQKRKIQDQMDSRVNSTKY